ncbi:uncharacterized protein [Coffea arabica]|uniref:Uncharacterized protein n=1 Tax=Coffea arabica TaxID=13443 RepID=A0ABM4U343_COFAR|nr:uncharacterized protein LOC113739978 [Coffea arabica]
MGILCFVLDLRSLSPSLLRDLKQSLLQLANYYAIYTPSGGNSGLRTQSKPLLDRIGLCYIFTNRISCSVELKVAYSPTGNFSLRGFHHAVNNLPTDAFSPEFDISGSLSCTDMKISSILSDNVLYSWGGHARDITRKVFLISACIVQHLDDDTKKVLMDAADMCVSVEFIFIQHMANHLGDGVENINNFIKQIGDLENCSFRSCLSDAHVFSGMAKQWFQELKDDVEGSLHSRFIFKSNLLYNVNQLLCNLCRCFNPIVDGFIPCQTCWCHGIPLDKSNVDQSKGSYSCPETGQDLRELDLNENSVKIGENTILFMPSFECCQKLPQIVSPIDFHVIERTPLGSLNEGFIFGASYVVAPSTFNEFDETDKSEQNNQLFQVICHLLNSLDQGLVCSSNCNVETMRETSFLCYYLLLPSDKGMMLLRRLVASEEILPVVDAHQFTYSTMAKEMESLVRSSLLKIEASTYSPQQHERGFHQKLNFLVKESLQFGAIPPKIREAPVDFSTLNDSEEAVEPTQAAAEVVEPTKMPPLSEEVQENEANSYIEEEWERLIVTELPQIHSPIQVSKPKLDHPLPSPSQSNRKIDEKTSKILERLEIPRQLKKKAVSPKTPGIGTSQTCMLTKKPLIPYGPSRADDQSTLASQPIKPNFQKLKRKR